MARRKSMRKQRQQRRSRGGADEAPKTEEPKKSFMDNLFGSDEAKAPAAEEAPKEEPAADVAAEEAPKEEPTADVAAEEAPKADEAPAAPEEDKPNALASLFGSDDKSSDKAAAEVPAAETKKKRSRRRCKCYTPKKLRTVCKRMRSRRHRRSARKQKPMTYNSSNQFRDMYAAPQQEPMGF